MPVSNSIGDLSGAEERENHAKCGDDKVTSKRRGMIATGVWIPERLLNLAKEKDPNFNLSHFLTKQLQKQFDSTDSQVDSFLSKRENKR